MRRLQKKALPHVFKKIKNKLVLLKLREVCTTWFNVIDSLFDECKLWEELCSSDEIKPWIYEILRKRYPSLEYEGNSLNQSEWKEVFICYKSWRMSIKTSCVYHSFDFGLQTSSAAHNSKRLTCMDVWANYIAIGNDIGSVYFFYLGSKLKQLPSLNYRGSFISEIKFWCTDSRRLLAVISLGGHDIKFWDVENQQHIDSPYGNQSSTAIECKHYKLFIANNLEILEYKWYKSGISTRQEIALPPVLNTITKQLLNIVGMNIGWNKLTIVACNLSAVLTTSLKMPPLLIQFPTLVPEDSSAHALQQFSNKKFVLCHMPISDVLLIIDDLFIYVGKKNQPHQTYEWKTFKLEDSLEENISSALLFANVLLLGLRSGLLHAYFFNNLHHLSNLILHTVPLRVFDLSMEPIIDLRVTEIQGVFHIFATSGSSLHVIQFPIFWINDKQFSK